MVDANIAAATATCESPLLLNCATNGQIMLNEVVLRINKLLKKNILPEHDCERPGDIKHSFADINLLKEKINFIPKYSFEEGLKLTTNYYMGLYEHN